MRRRTALDLLTRLSLVWALFVLPHQLAAYLPLPTLALARTRADDSADDIIKWLDSLVRSAAARRPQP